MTSKLKPRFILWIAIGVALIVAIFIYLAGSTASSGNIADWIKRMHG